VRRGWRAAGAIFVIAVALDFAWEMSQSVFFAPMGRTLTEGIWRCFRASLGDGVIVLGIATAGWFVFRRPDWFDRPGFAGYVLIEVTGVVLAVIVEWAALRRGRWAYRPAMPLVPGFGIGLIPVLQMAILPPLIFELAARALGKTSRSK